MCWASRLDLLQSHWIINVAWIFIMHVNLLANVMILVQRSISVIELACTVHRRVGLFSHDAHIDVGSVALSAI